MASKKQSGRRVLRRRRSQKASRTAEQFFAMPEADQENWNKVIAVIREMRNQPRDSLAKISKEVIIRSDTVARLGTSALRKRSNGRYVAKSGDQLLRAVRAFTPEGVIEIGVRGSRQASTLGQYWDAVQRYLRRGDDSGLPKFQGKQIRDATGRKFPLITDRRELDRLGYAGVLSFESMYARTA